MKKLLIALVGAALVLGACGDKKEEATPAPTPPAQETPAAGDVTFDAAQAETTYASCIGCHGGVTEGGALHKTPLAGQSADYVLEIMKAGKGSMPPQAHISDEEAENLAAWIAAQ